jgi:hypothetical protein
MQLRLRLEGVARGVRPAYDTRVVRVLFLLTFAWVALGCQCAPATPQSVTIRVRNTANDPIYVNETGGLHGLSIQRKSGATDWKTIIEEMPCACMSCDSVCSGTCSCSVDAGVGSPIVRKILPGESYARTWGGVIQTDSTNSCGFLLGGSACYRSENAPVDETFRLQLCYVYSISGVTVGDGGTAPGALPDQGQTCVGREFKPNDLEAEVTPERGAACTTTADCSGKDELCFSGACTAGCPANDFPALSATWSVRVGSVDDQGFFTTSTADGKTIYTGTGTISSALYNSNSLTLSLTRTGISGALTAGLDLTLPSGQAPPFTSGQPVTVKVIDGSSSDNPENRALTIRDSSTGALLIAADVGQAGTLLDAADLTPFSLTWEAAIVGCRAGDCGKELFSPLRVTGPGGAISLQPGNTAPQSTADGTYRLLNVGNSSWATTTCHFKLLRPFLLFRERANP